jgi:hypothetical protein
MNLSKEQVYANLKKVNAKIEEIKDKKGKVVLKTGNLFLEQYGAICDIEDTNKLLYIHTWLGEFVEKCAKAAKAVGLPSFNGDKVEIQGFTIVDWQEDVKARVHQLNEKIILKGLKAAKELLEKNLSDDDAFKADMDKVGDMLAGVNLED